MRRPREPLTELIRPAAASTAGLLRLGSVAASSLLYCSPAGSAPCVPRLHAWYSTITASSFTTAIDPLAKDHIALCTLRFSSRAAFTSTCPCDLPGRPSHLMFVCDTKLSIFALRRTPASGSEVSSTLRRPPPSASIQPCSLHARASPPPLTAPLSHHDVDLQRGPVHLQHRQVHDGHRARGGAPGHLHEEGGAAPAAVSVEPYCRVNRSNARCCCGCSWVVGR